MSLKFLFRTKIHMSGTYGAQAREHTGTLSVAKRWDIVQSWTGSAMRALHTASDPICTTLSVELHTQSKGTFTLSPICQAARVTTKPVVFFPQEQTLFRFLKHPKKRSQLRPSSAP